MMKTHDGDSVHCDISLHREEPPVTTPQSLKRSGGSHYLGVGYHSKLDDHSPGVKISTSLRFSAKEKMPQKPRMPQNLSDRDEPVKVSVRLAYLTKRVVEPDGSLRAREEQRRKSSSSDRLRDGE